LLATCMASAITASPSAACPSSAQAPARAKETRDVPPPSPASAWCLGHRATEEHLLQLYFVSPAPSHERPARRSSSPWKPCGRVADPGRARDRGLYNGARHAYLLNRKMK
jgi:hypothetical protein